jgi:DNA-binding FadR family transcriptional regulator
MSKVESARTALEQLLEGGELLANRRLPPERDLCAQFGVSRNTLRTALDLLEAQGKIWRRVGSGTYAGNAPPMDLQGLVAISETTSPIELMELRLILEPAIRATTVVAVLDPTRRSSNPNSSSPNNRGGPTPMKCAT